MNKQQEENARKIYEAFMNDAKVVVQDQRCAILVSTIQIIEGANIDACCC